MPETDLLHFRHLLKKIMSAKKRVKCINEYKTTYLKFKHNYEVESEDGNWYYFKFGDELIRYPKHYFIEI